MPNAYFKNFKESTTAQSCYSTCCFCACFLLPTDALCLFIGRQLLRPGILSRLTGSLDEMPWPENFWLNVFNRDGGVKPAITARVNRHYIILIVFYHRVARRFRKSSAGVQSFAGFPRIMTLERSRGGAGRAGFPAFISILPEFRFMRSTCTGADCGRVLRTRTRGEGRRSGRQAKGTAKTGASRLHSRRDAAESGGTTRANPRRASRRAYLLSSRIPRSSPSSVSGNMRPPIRLWISDVD
ncbi:MAG: hypothetical protein AW11_02490 [Candidatus Accumulibacter regalis]|jgi:hypothetical protein|uniref:Uncharacterized protein n=1 Tax=Accumulibacter regalis TaxID=522306 RepID=A0A011PJC5_ACCRE|nr:MAG: hypothetical protein AW11_02490 [Candidatus Accumulibacter regalis]